MIKVFFVDDHPYVREGLKAFLSTQEGIEVVGEAGDGESALDKIKEAGPDVVVVDLHLPGMGGVELTGKIKDSNPEMEIVILSSFSEDEEVIAAIDNGALSYLMKDSPPQKLIKAIRAAQDGEPVLHPGIARKLMKRVRRKEPLIQPLTSREKDVLGQLVKGYSNKEIGKELYISELTVKTHVSNILRKLDVKDRTQAVVKAIDLKLIDR